MGRQNRWEGAVVRGKEGYGERGWFVGQFRRGEDYVLLVV